MNKEIETSIKALAEKADAKDANDALKFSQAALNLIHVIEVVAGIKHLERNP